MKMAPFFLLCFVISISLRAQVPDNDCVDGECEICLTTPPTLTVSPPPVNGTFVAGQTVNFCYTISEWGVTTSTEWLHGVTVDFGEGWDYSTLISFPPAACSDDGTWSWYERWTSCNSGAEFGPGFAYESSFVGFGCIGTSNDNDPGNNYGDALSNCFYFNDTITPISFCWSIDVLSSAQHGADVSLSIEVWSDGISGGWTEASCITGGSSFIANVQEGCTTNIPPSVTPSTDDCMGNCNGNILVSSPQDGTTNYSLLLFDSNGNVVNSLSNITNQAIFEDLCEGTYIVYARDEISGCISSQAAIVNQDRDIVDFTFDYSCEDELYTLTASVTPFDPNTTFEWFFNEELVSTLPSFTTDMIGPYTLITTNSAQCQSMPISKWVEVYLLATSVYLDTDNQCPGEPVVLTAQGGLAYDWGPFGQTESITVFPTENTSYLVSITVEDDCIVEESIFVNVENHPTFDLSVETPFDICVPDSITVKATQTNNFNLYSFEWENGSNNRTITIAPEDFGDYLSYEVRTVITNCFIYDSIRIVPPPVLPEPIFECAPITESITLTAFEGLPDSLFQAFVWSTGETTRSIIVPPVATTTTYSVTVTAEDCTQEDAITISPVEAGHATISTIPSTYCQGDTIELLASLEGGLAPYTYDWGSSSTSTSSKIQVVATEQDTIELTVMDAANCTSSAAFAVEPNTIEAYEILATVNGVPTSFESDPTYGSNDPRTSITLYACYDNEVTLEIVGDFQEVIWSTGHIGSTINIPEIGETPVLRATLTDQNGCDGELVIYVFFIDGFTSNSYKRICEGQSTSLYDHLYYLEGGGDFLWNTGETTPSITVTEPGTYEVSITNIFGCEEYAIYEVEQFPNPISPTISCTTTQNSIEFQWNAQIGTQTNNFSDIWNNSNGILLNDSTYLIEDLLPGEEVEITISSCTGGCCETYTFTCANEGCNDIFAFIDPVPQLCSEDSPYLLSASQSSDNGTGEYSWSGPGVTSSSGIFDPTASGPGIFTVELLYTQDFCNYTETTTIEVLESTTPPLLSCQSDLTSITVSWPDDPTIQGYQVIGPAGVLDGNTYTINGLTPSTSLDITVEAIPASGCEPAAATISCATSDCPSIEIALPETIVACTNDEVFTINASLNGVPPLGTFMWSGDCLVDASTGTFDPSLCGPGTYTAEVSYTEGPCSYTAQTEFVINAQPTADFTVASGPICVTESIQVQANNLPNANYNWDFDGGTAISSAGAGPFNASWNTAGTKTITLFVEVDGCLSELVSQTVQVDPALDAPLVNCADVTLTSVSFIWEEVANATTYEVNVLEGPTGTLDGTTYTVVGLSPNESVTIEVTALTGSNCGPVSTTQSCTAFDCPDYEVQIDGPTAPLCATGDPIQLFANVTNGDGTGTITWSGNGIIDATNGIFDPEQAGTGTHIITANYQQGPCPGSATITIVVDPVEASSFVLASEVLCVDQSTTLTYTGGAPANAAYDWDFDGGIVESGSGQGPLEIRWTTPGIKTIGLQVTVDGCAGAVSTQQVDVQSPIDAPVVTCTATTSTLLFEWEEVPGSLGYTVNVLSGSAGVQAGNTYFIQGLQPEELVTIEVTAISAPPCSNVSTEWSCSTAPCPDYGLDITVPVTEFCLDTAPVSFSGMVIGDAGDGSFSWAGPGMDADSGEFDPAQAGVGMHTITLTYTEGSCVYTASIDIEVFAKPTADFELAPEACNNEIVVVSYTGTASANAAFNWDFGGATVLSGAGIGPFELSWPQGGNYSVTLVVEENGCSSEAVAQSVQITPAVDLELLIDPTFCLTEYTGPVLLEAAIDGVPSLGEGITFSGPGIVDGIAGLFDPLEAGEGTALVTLTYTDGPCTSTESVALEVIFTKTISNIRTSCASDNATYTVLYDALIFGESQTISSDPIPSGEVFVLEYATAPDCAVEAIEIQQDCNCPGSPGTMSTDQASCSPTMVSAVHNGDADIPVGSELVFVLHDNAGNILGTILDQQAAPTFTINPSIELDKTYYISPVLQEIGGSCTVVEAGVPIAFTTAIDLQLPEDQFVCSGQSILLNASYFGNPTLSWSPTTGLSCTNCPSPTATPQETTTYTLTATNSFGCNETVSTTVFVDELPFGELPPTPDFVCRGEPFEYCLPDGVSYTWTGPNNYVSIDQCLVWPDFDPVYAGLYTIEIAISPTCTLTETIELIAPPDLTVNFITPSNLKVCPTDVFLLEADIENAVEYRWFPASNVLSPDSSATLAFTQESLLFTVQAYDSFGCLLEETVFVEREIQCAFDPDEYEPDIPLSELQSGMDEVEQRIVQPTEKGSETIQLFPNPTAGELTIQADGVLLQEIVLFDLHGRILLQQKTEGTQEVLQLNDLAAGTYWMQLIHEGGAVFRKVVVVRP